MEISAENASGEWELEFEPLDDEVDIINRSISNNNQTAAAAPTITSKCIDEDSKATVVADIPPLRDSNLTNTQKSFVAKGSTTTPSQNDSLATGRFNNNVMKRGITSSASFLELEKAIGATIALSLGGSSDELDNNGRIPHNGSTQNLDTLQQHKIQRLRQKQQYQQYNNPLQMQIPQTPGSPMSTRGELNQFLNEPESRSIILFHSPHILPTTIRDACQKFGVLYYIRPEFHSKGVTLLCYFDLRSAVRAKAELTQQLGDDADIKVYYSIQLHASSNKSEEFRLFVKNIPDSHSESDVQSIFSRYGPIRTFEKVTLDDEQHDQRQKQKSEEIVEGKPSPESKEENDQNDDVSPNSSVSTSYHVEFFNIQDARLAASELSASSNQIFGPNVSITFSTLDERKQQMCKNLLTTLSKWRTELATVTYSAVTGTSPKYAGHGMPMINHHHQFAQVHPNATGYHNAIPVMSNSAAMDSSMIAGPTYMPTQIAVPIMYGYPTQPSQIFPPTNPMPQATNSTNVMTNYPIPHQNSVSAYGNYDRSRAINDQSQNYYNQNYNRETDSTRPNQQQQQQQQQQYNHQHYNQQQIPLQSQPSREHTSIYPQIPPALDQQMLSVSTPVTSQVQFKGQVFPAGHTSPVSATGGINSQPMYVAAHSPDTRPQHHNGGHGSSHGGRGNSRFVRGPTVCTSITLNGVYMNSPVLDSVDPEFALDIERLASGSELRTTVMVRNIPNKYHQHMLLEEVNVNHEGSYDFFYLPIDFKNRCNVGYCFINFLDPKLIIPFVREFHGQRWKSFNSEKVCVVTFARIQGKASMISRFQNSSLLEKDDEYQPLLFYSSGPDRGKQEPFPSLRRLQQSQQQYSMQIQQQQYSPNLYQQQHHQQQLRINYNSSPSSAADNYSHSYVLSDDRRTDHNSNNLHG